MKQNLQTWWMSFVDPDKPKGKRFLGVCIVDGRSFEEAHALSHIYGCNPGGEMEGHDVTSVAHKIHPSYKNRLMSKEELDSINFDTDIYA